MHYLQNIAFLITINSLYFMQVKKIIIQILIQLLIGEKKDSNPTIYFATLIILINQLRLLFLKLNNLICHCLLHFLIDS